MPRATFAFTLILAFQFVCWQPAAIVAQGSPQEPRPNDESGRQQPASSGLVLTVTQDGLLTVTARRQPLSLVLGELSRRAKLSIVVDDDIAANQVSIQMQKVPLLEGLAQILSAYDAFYLYSADRTAPAVISTVWVYARGVGRDVQPVPASRWASSKEFEKQLDDPDATVRARAYEGLLERQGSSGLGTVLKALADSSPEVREIGLSAAVDSEFEVPSAELLRIVQTDPSPSVRFRAIEAAELGGEAALIAETAQHDENEHVRNYAAQVLRRLAAKKGPGR